MPPRWPRKPDRQDPTYPRLGDRINFALHIAFFAAINSGAWFFQEFLGKTWPWLLWFTLAWLILILSHGVYIFAIADYRQGETTP